MSESFWAKVLFREFISHYVGMSDDEKAKDVSNSLYALSSLTTDNGSFGAKMVMWANERMSSNAAKASKENGAKGGRPRKNSDAEQAGGAVDSNTFTHTAAAPSANHQPPANVIVALNSRKPAKPAKVPSTTELYDFAHLEGIDDSLAREWYDMTISRNWCDREGNKIKNWQAACRSYVTTRIQKLSQQEG